MNRLAELEKFIEDDPDDAFLHYAYLVEYVKTKPIALEERLKMLIVRFPFYLPAHEKLARHYFENHNEQMAIKTIRPAIALAKEQGADKPARELQALLDELEFEG